MFGTRNTKRVLLAMLATLFVLAFAYQAFAFESTGSAPFTYAGKIVAIDGKILTVQAGPDAQKTFNLRENADVMKCDMAASLDDLKIGDEVTVSYFDEGDGTLVGSGIIYSAADMRC